MKISVKAARVNAGWLQEDAAKAIGMSVPTFIQKERGEKEFTEDQITKMCEMYKCGREDLDI